MTVRMPSLMLTDIALSKVLLVFIRHTSAQTNVFLDKNVVKMLVQKTRKSVSPYAGYASRGTEEISGYGGHVRVS
jgi:hypothetical protein